MLRLNFVYLGHGDKCFDDLRAGCVELLQTIQKRVKPKFHIFGHIHEGKYLQKCLYIYISKYILFLT